eukprot:CAMPEP_0175054432 /NCGR_PEP_ID=MMETSP0052_2-20121109/9504_1 /TAXON_ID=51329 ORGANISM="Polytomella parva, Strain SAG 63-3" /NCGR_SAMPLE_ID=MMETSP0052_2 /ASSEMBLY_ACC=CAM_ASM_000194 /LENGTH=334 /DNA_ID=CAMNT_0016319131 /DNA_START=74 /DNA_END=1078 /DNA_ORIENTATION=+
MEQVISVMTTSLTTKEVNGEVVLSPMQVALSSLGLLCLGILSYVMELDVHHKLGIAAIRMVVQLSVLGGVLGPIFAYNYWWLVLSYCSVMVLVASLEAVQRPQSSYKGMWRNAILTMSATAGILITYTSIVVLGLSPRWDAQYVIPMLGMLLGNATSAVSVGLSTVLEALKSERNLIEQYIAFGATRSEATHVVAKRSLTLAMTPLINNMSVMGIVTIPGMMTGQILAGANPFMAARYQMVIIFVLGASCGLSAYITVLLACRKIVDEKHRFRMDRIHEKPKLTKTLSLYGERLTRFFLRLKAFLASVCCCGCGIQARATSIAPGLNQPLINAQ